MVLALILTGIGLGTEPGSDAAIQTGKDVYSLAHSPGVSTLSIEATYTNTTDSATYIMRCGHADLPESSLEKRMDDGWVNAYAYTCQAVLSPPIKVEPGERYTYTIEMKGFHARELFPRFTVRELPGLYQLVYDVRDSFDMVDLEPGEPLPLDSRVSNTFVIQE